jgi:hypothetical protein
MATSMMTLRRMANTRGNPRAHPGRARPRASRTGRAGAQPVGHMISWDSSCVDVTIESGQRRVHAVEWAGVTDSAVIECQYLGPSVFWARFRTRTSLVRARRRWSPPRDPYCVPGREFVSADPLFSHAQFRQLCDDLGGRYSPTPSHAAS